MMRTFNIGSRWAVVALAVGLAACSDSTAPNVPSSITTQAASPTASSGTATISGTMSVMGSASTGPQVLAVVTLTITVTGTNISATVSPGGSFTLPGVPAGNVELHFTGPGLDDRDTIDDVAEHEDIRLAVTISGTHAVVTITNRSGQGNQGDQSELEGLIGSIDVSARTFVVDGITIHVPTTVTIRHGDQTVAFADLKAGQRVHVRGTKTGSTMTASVVMLQDENPK